MPSHFSRLVLPLAFCLTPVLFAAERIIPAQFNQIHGLIKPKQSEQTWTQIPWRTSLWQARQLAASEGKPILLWEMDGHPLGCT